MDFDEDGWDLDNYLEYCGLRLRLLGRSECATVWVNPKFTTRWTAHVSCGDHDSFTVRRVLSRAGQLVYGLGRDNDGPLLVRGICGVDLETRGWVVTWRLETEEPDELQVARCRLAVLAGRE